MTTAPNSEVDDLPFVSVILPVRDESAWIERSLGAVLAQDYPAERFEVLVVDGRSRDDTRELVRRLARRSASRGGPRVTLLDNPGRTAPCAMNLGTAAARGDIIARIDGHCEIGPDHLLRAVAHLRPGGVDGVGGPVITEGDGPTARAIAAAMGSPFGVGGSAFRTCRSETIDDVDTVPFPVYTREIVERAGPYDEELTRNQDDEYNYRIRTLGGRLRLAPDLVSRYGSRATLRSLARQYFQYGFYKVRVLQKHPWQMKARQFVPAAAVAMAAATGLAALAGSRTGRTAHTARCLAAAGAVAYGALSTTAAVAATRRENLPVSSMPTVAAAFALLHGGYGSGFLAGLWRFRRQFRESR